MKRPHEKLADVLVPSAPVNPLIPASFPFGCAWFVAVCSPFEMHWTTDKDGKGYFPVERRINELGFETYVPVETRNVVRNRRKFERVTPLLGANYIFVRFDRERDDWGHILADRGIHDILGAMKIPQRIPDLLIERIRREEDAGVFDFTKPYCAFASGDDVEIKEGPFAGLMAKVRSASPKKRVRLLLAGLGSAEIDPAFLAKVG